MNKKSQQWNVTIPFMLMIYDSNNVFARIVRQEMACSMFKETTHSLAFHDINPQASIHLLVIPRGPYVHVTHFLETASGAEKEDFWGLMAVLPGDLGVKESGYRWITNAGSDGRQEVPHFHMHLLAGGPLPLFRDGKVVD